PPGAASEKRLLRGAVLRAVPVKTGSIETAGFSEAVGLGEAVGFGETVGLEETVDSIGNLI
ncbi:MAG: hypothetical protein PUC47_08225, partial [Oscillospiraceae bacterium]|nr:hypothetical protein [Oscillospiraceae bacterium]